MAIDPKSEEGLALRKLSPLETMPVRQYDSLCADINIIDKPKGSFLFKRGDPPDSFIFIIKGDVSLEAEEFQVEVVSGGTDSSKFALAHQFPRQISARALSKVRYAYLQLNAFDKQETKDIEGEETYMVEDNDGEEATEDWMSALLKSPIFQRLPAMNLQQVLMKLQDIEVKKGETIFQQGDEGKYYYLIKQGRCALSRKASPRAKEIKLLELRRNETFGEDSLLSGALRSMTVTAITDMLLSRIDKDCFKQLIKGPALNYVDYAQLLSEYEKGEAITIDIRGTDEYNKNHIEGSRSIPFFSIRMHLKDLSLAAKKIIIICEDGKTSMAAAFVLIKNGIDAEILKDGMQGVPEEEPEPEPVVEEVAIVEEAIAAENSVAETEEVAEFLTAEGAELSLEAEIANMDLGFNLEQEYESLKAENEYLTQELEKVRKQYKMLYTQTGKLKMAFDKLQASKK